MCYDEAAKKKKASCTMKKPARKKSLLVDYSKSKASPKGLERMDDMLPSSPASVVDANKGYAMPDSMSLANLVKETRPQQRSSPQEEKEDSEISFSSLPSLNPMDKKQGSSHHGEQLGTQKSLLGASDFTLEMEGDDSFCQASLTDLLTDVAVAAAPVGNRRAQLQPTRKQQSLSSLNLSPKRGGPVLSFSLRRRSSQTNNIKTRPGAPLGRSKTWDDDGGAFQRFNQSLGQLKFDASDLDATEHSSLDNSESNLKSSTTSTTNPAQNRRSLLVRHSSVSALQIQTPHCSLECAPSPIPSNSLRPTPTRKNSMRVFQNTKPATTTSPTREELPNTIEIRPKERKHRRGSHHDSKGSLDFQERNRSSSSIGRHSLRGTSERKSTAIGRHSLRGNSSHTGHSLRGGNSNHGVPRRSGAMNANLPTIEVDDMSCSTQSYFLSSSRCPPTTRLQRDLLSGTKITGSSRRDLMKGTKMGGSSRRDLMGTSRRDMMQRQMSSRRNLGTNMGSLKSFCGGGNSDMMMDESSQFVTGSRIRRGSCRHLLA